MDADRKREDDGTDDADERDEADREADVASDREAGGDDGEPLRTLPVRRLPLADGPGRTEARPRAWHWVPLGALVTLATTTIAALVAAAAVPGAEEAVRSVAAALEGVEGDAARGAALEAVLSGPSGPAVERVFVAMAAAFCAGIVLAGLLATSLGRAGVLEAGLGPAVFVVLSLVFVGGGVPGFGLVAVTIAAMLGFAGGWLGSRLRGIYLKRRG